ncbi:hypothetical protein AB3S75_028835 [Citrus x aurantiifolia]
MEGRRHSVDIPISRTLIALRRVRSLRDPSTNSMSKFSALLDNVNWETNSSNGISSRFDNGCKGLFESEILSINGLKKEKDDDLELHCGLDNSKFMSFQNLGWIDTDNPNLIKQVDRLDNYQSKEEEVDGHESLGERRCINHLNREFDMCCSMPYSQPMEDVGFCNGPNVGSSSMEDIDQSASIRKLRYKNEGRLCGAANGGASRVSTPCPSISEIMSNHSRSLFANEEIDVNQSHHGCGLSCCWSRTPRSRQSNLSSDLEDNPLLSGEIGETAHYGRSGHKLINNEISTYSETPWSLSQKFRPKFFDELVGQNVVVRSLLSAISRGMVTSFYLFHGPRGTGKTSASRIFAAALNCLSLEDQKPCGLCRECALFSSGRSRDVKEVDSVRINRSDRVGSLMKSAFLPPFSSRFKIFIIDECQLLHGETWATVLNSLENISQHVVFVMITPELDKLPRSALSRSQKYHFPKIKDGDIASRLRRICVEEAINFDQAALDFIAAKSNGSIRDAEMLLDQLSLLGKKITLSLAYELIGIVSDDELLDLLDLALSSDTSNTVIRARELMRSKIDPMQLISQLANLIMDILAGKCLEDCSEARKIFFGKHTSEADMQKLSRALKILSETEKQLRMSKHQTTWLTVALLQLSSSEYSLDLNDSKLCLRYAHDKDGDSHCTISPRDSFKHLVRGSCVGDKANKLGALEDYKGTLESIWHTATELCQSNSLKTFLRKQGKLSSLHVNHGLAVAELEFHHRDYVSRAEKSWKLIASFLQSVLGCNVEIRGRHTLTCSSDCGSQMSHNCCHKTDVVLSPQEPETQPGCFPRTLRLQKKLRASDTSEMVCTSNKLALSIPKKTSFDTYISVDDPHVFYGSSNYHHSSVRDEDGPQENSDVLCWRTPTFPLKKAGQMAHQRKRSNIMDCILPCTNAE